MKRFICTFIVVLCLCACWAGNFKKYKVWEQPVAELNPQNGVSMGTLLDIYRVEFADNETRVFMHITHFPHYWVKFVKETYLFADGKKYPVKDCDGLKLDEEHYMPSSGKEDVVFRFAPLPQKTQKFDFIEGDAKENFKILGLENIDTRIKRLDSSLWRNENTGEWEIEFYDDFAIYDCRYWQYKQQVRKGDKYSFVLTDGKSDLVVNVDKPHQGKRMISINGKKAECSLITTSTLSNYPQKDETTILKNTHFKQDTAVVIGWLRNMPKELWDKSQEYSVMYYDPFFQFKEVNNYCKLDSLGRFEIKVPLCNSTEVFMDWKHTYLNTVLEPGETYYLLYDFKDGHKLFMGKNCRLQNELLAHPIPMLDTEYKGKYRNEVTAQEEFDILEPRFCEAKNMLQKQISENPTISQRYQQYANGHILCTYAEALLSGAAFVKDNVFPREYLSKAEKIWSEIPQPYTQYRDFSQAIGNVLFQETRQKFSTPLGKTWMFINCKYYPKLLKEHQAIGDIKITDQEIAIVEQWGKETERLQIKLYEMKDGKERDNMYKNARATTLFKRALAITQRPDIDKMLKEDEPLLGAYFVQQIADSLECNKVQKDIMLAKAFMYQLEANYVPFSDFGVNLIKQSINSDFVKNKVLAENQRYLDLQNKNVDTNNFKSAPAGISDGEKLLRTITEPYKGKIVLIDVWGTWCSPCKAALARSKELFMRLAPYDMVYLYLAKNSSVDGWKNLIKEYNLLGDNIAHYNLPDAQQSAIENYLNVHSYPSYRLVDKNGNLVDMKVDARQLDNLEKVVKGVSE